MAGRRNQEGTRARLLIDLASRVGGIALLVFAAVLFLAGAIGGLALAGRLGAVGWIIYLLVLVTWALVFAPFVAGAFTLHQSGSRTRREAQRRRLEQDRRRFLTRRRADRDEE